MEIRRKVKNVVYKYSEAERIVREATSNDAWGPSTTVMSQIADMTHNYHAFDEIMQLIWKRLNDKGKNWRHVYKALVLLEYLIKCGDDRVANECKANIHTIQTLKDFQYFEEHKDHGTGIREKSKHLVNMLNDNEILSMEKEKGKQVKEKFHKPNSALGSHQRRRPGELGREIRKQNSRDSMPKSVMQLNFDDHPRRSRPDREEDDDADLQRAIELSKEEHEKALRKQRETDEREELKIKMALEQSKKEEEMLSSLRLPPPTCKTNGKEVDNSGNNNSDLFNEENNLFGDGDTRQSRQSYNPFDNIAKLTEASRVFEQTNGDLNSLDRHHTKTLEDPWSTSASISAPPSQYHHNNHLTKTATNTTSNNSSSIPLDFDPWAHNKNPAKSNNNNQIHHSTNLMDSDTSGFYTGTSSSNHKSNDAWSSNSSKVNASGSSSNIIDDIFGDEKPNAQFSTSHRLSFESNTFDIYGGTPATLESYSAFGSNMKSSAHAQSSLFDRNDELLPSIVGSTNVGNNTNAELFDPWPAAALTDPKIKEPRNVNTGSLASLNDLSDYTCQDDKIHHAHSVMDLSKKQKTPQEFLGENAKLVNLDNLVPIPKAVAKNPFGLSAKSSGGAMMTAASNPFDSSTTSTVSRMPMNQMNAAPAIGSSDYASANSYSMFSQTSMFPSGNQNQFNNFTHKPIIMSQHHQHQHQQQQQLEHINPGVSSQSNWYNPSSNNNIWPSSNQNDQLQSNPFF